PVGVYSTRARAEAALRASIGWQNERKSAAECAARTHRSAPDPNYVDIEEFELDAPPAGGLAVSEIEKLTPSKPSWPSPAQAKALRIIDAQAARIAELEAKINEVWDRWEMAQVDPACRNLALDEIGDLLRIKPTKERQEIATRC